jgi:HYR domain
VTFDDASSPTPIGSFPFARTNVSLTVSDGTNSDSDIAAINIVDTIPPAISCPANIVADATMPSGAIVNYSNPTATDSCMVQSVACVAPSGSTFGVGTNTVQCTVIDGANHSAACSFTVRVKSPAEQAGELIDTINGLPGVKDSTKHSFSVKLEAALAAIAAGHTSACGNLQALMQAVQARAGKELTDVQAADLIVDITRIRAALGCK